MRSIIFTTILLLVVALLGVGAFLQVSQGGLYVLFGKPTTPVGELLYPEFPVEQVTKITVYSNTTTAEFEKKKDGWYAVKPWDDRMDSRAAAALLALAQTAKVVDSEKRDQIAPELAGFTPSNLELKYENAQGESLAYFRMGRRTPLLSLHEDQNIEPLPTTYVLPLEKGRKSDVYAVTGHILPLFKNDFNYLRDHRPLYFNPLLLETIRIETKTGDLELGREHLKAPWRIVKPMTLRTDTSAVKALLEGLFELQAMVVRDVADVSLATTDVADQGTQISMKSFGVDEEVVLSVYSPTSPEARTVLATVSDRPGALFELPLSAEENLVSLSDLPLKVNDLRDTKLTNLNIASLRGIAIQSATSPTVLLMREPPAKWTASMGGKEILANEQRLFALLKAVTDTRVLEFATDAAPENLRKWGLDQPLLKLSFLAANDTRLQIDFGFSREGYLFAKRKNEQTIMRVDSRFLKEITTEWHRWQDSLLWSLSRVDLQSIERRTSHQNQVLNLEFDWLNQAWKANRGGKDLTAKLIPEQANFLLAVLENLRVKDWLRADDALAIKTLKTPLLSFKVRQNIVDEFGDPTGIRELKLDLAIDKKTNKVYGRSSERPLFFTLDPELLLKLGSRVLDQ